MFDVGQADFYSAQLTNSKQSSDMALNHFIDTANELRVLAFHYCKFLVVKTGSSKMSGSENSGNF